MFRRSVLTMTAVLGLAASSLLVACGGEASTSTQPVAPASTAARHASPQPDAPAEVATVSDRYGPSWSGRLGDTVQIEWTDENGGTYSERVAVLAVKRLPDRGGDGGDEGYVAYAREYAIKVRLTSLDAHAARWPTAYQLLQLSDGVYEEDGVWGLGEDGGPDPGRVGKSSVGWLHQRAQQGFVPTQVVMHIGAWTIKWRLE
jgi:hypothetical protein